MKPTLLDRIKLHKTKKSDKMHQRHQSSDAMNTPSAPKQPVAQQAKAAPAAKVPGVNDKMAGQAKQDNGRPPKEVKSNPLSKSANEQLGKALTQSQKRKISDHIHRSLNIIHPEDRTKNVVSPNFVNDQPTRTGVSAESPTKTTTPHGQVANWNAEAVQANDPKFKEHMKGAGATIKENPQGWAAVGPHAPEAFKNPQPKIPLGAKIKHKGEELIGRLKTAIKTNPKIKTIKSPEANDQEPTKTAMRPRAVIAKAHNEVTDLLKAAHVSGGQWVQAPVANNSPAPPVQPPAKVEATPKFNQPKKKLSTKIQKPKVKVTGAYRKPGSFDLGHFVLGMLATSPAVSRIANAAKNSLK